uniref:WH1 domain-containing protein n=1 Tax=Panagrolaimus superbus TaxID=310955 RepID=A0A914YEV6_9BILA
MSFTSVRSAIVDILFYRNDLRDWRKPDGAEVSSSSEEGRATVHIIQEPEAGYRFRIYAVRINDNRPLVNQLLYENFHYKVATPVFHQWKNEEKQVIGLSFINPDDATIFSQSIKRIIENLSVPQYQQVNNNVSNGVYQDPQAYYQQSNNRDIDQESIGSGHSAALTNYRQHQHCDQKTMSLRVKSNAIKNLMANFQDLQQLSDTSDFESKAESATDSAFDDVFEDESVCTRKSSAASLQYGQQGAQQQQQQQQRRCSQGSSGSSGTPSSSNIYATAQPANGNGNGSTTNGHHSSSNGIPVVKAPVPPPAPPPPPAQLNLSSGSNNSSGSSNIAQISKNAPPAPPPPPPGLSLAEQLKNSTLRKTSAPVNKVTSDSSQTPSQQQPKLSTVNTPNFMGELAAKLSTIKNGKNCNADNISTSSSSGVSTASSSGGISSDNNTSDSGATIVATKKPGSSETSGAPKPWAKPNGNVTGITSVANGSLDSPKVQRKILNSSSVENSTVTVADLEQFKQDILTEVNKTKDQVSEIRQEIAKVAKMQQEMFEAIRASLQR